VGSALEHIDGGRASKSVGAAKRARQPLHAVSWSSAGTLPLTSLLDMPSDLNREHIPSILSVNLLDLLSGLEVWLTRRIKVQTSKQLRVLRYWLLE
jgi:hypothetical protein